MNYLVPNKFKDLIKSEFSKTKEEDHFDFANPKNYLNTYQQREDFRTGVSWHIPTQELIDELAKHSPLVSVCSGFAYTESLLKLHHKIDVIATDIDPTNTNTFCKKGEFFMDIETLDAANAIIKYSDRNVFMAWPPYDTDTAFQVAKTMLVGKHLIYVGESQGGCNADDDFFNYLDSNFEEITDHNATIPQWMGLHDYVYIYKKIKF